MEDVSGILQPSFISFGAELKNVRLRLKNRSAEIEFPFGTGLFTVFCSERKLKDGLSVFHLIILYMSGCWHAL
jgi:hypothetical protein